MLLVMFQLTQSRSGAQLSTVVSRGADVLVNMQEALDDRLEDRDRSLPQQLQAQPIDQAPEPPYRPLGLWYSGNNVWVERLSVVIQY